MRTFFFLRDTKVDGYARYQVRIVNSERAWDGLVVVLVDRSVRWAAHRSGGFKSLQCSDKERCIQKQE